jgi:predicted ArsR family transcriptional regulator
MYALKAAIDKVRLGEKLGENEIKILDLIKKDKCVTIAKMSEILGISTTAVEKNIAQLRDKGILKREGGDRGGSWKVLRVVKKGDGHFFPIKKVSVTNGASLSLSFSTASLVRLPLVAS